MLEAMSKLLRFYKQWTWKSEASERQRALVEAFLAEDGYVDHNGVSAEVGLPTNIFFRVAISCRQPVCGCRQDMLTPCDLSSSCRQPQTCLLTALHSQTPGFEACVHLSTTIFSTVDRMSSTGRGKHTTVGKQSVEGEGQSSRAPAERRSKYRDDRLPELNVPSNINMLKVNDVFKKIIQPRYVNFPSLEKMFPGLSTLFEEQGWVGFMRSQKSYSPSAVLEFYNNLGMHEDDLYTTVHGISFKITPNLFSRALQIPNNGVDVLILEVDPAVTYTMMTNEPFDEMKRIAKLNANTFPPLNRMIHHMFTTIIFPKDGSRELVNETHRTYHILRKEQINLPELMVDVIHECFHDLKMSIPYACPITSVIKFLRVSLTPNKVITLKSRSAYDINTATRMGYRMINGRVHRTLKGQENEQQKDEGREEDGEDVGADEASEEDDIHQEVHPHIPTTSQVPTSGDLKEFFAEQFTQLQRNLRYEFDHLNNRMNAIEENKGHMQRQLDTMEYEVMRLHDDYQNLHRPTPPGDDYP
ncbi:hypothetical protein Taro_026322 [Colocasia esculenta]|uniref:Putative plant transposon protein domain-containing protein n=1 Tax=Colocasia esculenta TaxID=4460 RepID=A0A843VGT0_COLES|nr:hypothetical protein [Colocasia esculenta]